MNRRFTLILALALLISTLGAGAVAAQGEEGVPWRCFTDRTSYQVCILQNGQIQDIYISGGTGIEAARFPLDLVRFAAATFAPSDVELLGRVSSGHGDLYAELYFVGESPAAARAAADWPDRGDTDVYLTTVFYGANGARILAVDFVYPNVTPTAAVNFTLPYTEGSVAAPAAPVAPAAPAANAPAAAPASTLDLTIVAPGTEQTCLARSIYTVRLREEPSTTSGIVDRLPFGTQVRADLRTVDDQWLRVNYLGQLAWVNARYLELTEACAELNAIAAIP